jgi:hypothetical protein
MKITMAMLLSIIALTLNVSAGELDKSIDSKDIQAKKYSEIITDKPGYITEAEIITDNNGDIILQKIKSIAVKNGSLDIRAYGSKLTTKTKVVLDGKTYEPDTKLTIDKNLNWCPVSSWE